VTIATELGVPRSTARGWLGKATAKVVISLDVTDLRASELQQEVLELRRRVKKLTARHPFPQRAAPVVALASCPCDSGNVIAINGRNVDRFIPSGSKTRSTIASAYGLWVICSTTKPAIQ
jgi:hypothetical protein